MLFIPDGAGEIFRVEIAPLEHPGVAVPGGPLQVGPLIVHQRDPQNLGLVMDRLHHRAHPPVRHEHLQVGMAEHVLLGQPGAGHDVVRKVLGRDSMHS